MTKHTKVVENAYTGGYDVVQRDTGWMIRRDVGKIQAREIAEKVDALVEQYGWSYDERFTDHV